MDLLVDQDVSDARETALSAIKNLGETAYGKLKRSFKKLESSQLILIDQAEKLKSIQEGTITTLKLLQNTVHEQSLVITLAEKITELEDLKLKDDHLSYLTDLAVLLKKDAALSEKRAVKLRTGGIKRKQPDLPVAEFSVQTEKSKHVVDSARDPNTKNALPDEVMFLERELEVGISPEVNENPEDASTSAELLNNSHDGMVAICSDDSPVSSSAVDVGEDQHGFSNLVSVSVSNGSELDLDKEEWVEIAVSGTQAQSASTSNCVVTTALQYSGLMPLQVSGNDNFQYYILKSALESISKGQTSVLDENNDGGDVTESNDETTIM